MLSESQHYVWSGLASESVTKPQQWPTTKPQKHSSSDFTLKRSVNSTPRKSSRLHIDRFLWSSLKQHYLHKEGWTLNDRETCKTLAEHWKIATKSDHTELSQQLRPHRKIQSQQRSVQSELKTEFGRSDMNLFALNSSSNTHRYLSICQW